MQFAGKPTGVAMIGKDTANQPFVFRDRLTILAATGCARITPCQKRCATGCANSALAIGVSKRDAAADQLINTGRVSPVIAQRRDRVISLLIGTNPENVRMLHGLNFLGNFILAGIV